MSEERRALRAEPQAEDPGTTAADSDTASGGPVTPQTDLVSHLRYVLKSMRPRQWMKALIVFLALIFSIEQEWQVSDVGSWAPLFGRTALVFVFFCLVSSADYLINDLADREADRHHPKKRHRLTERSTE